MTQRTVLVLIVLAAISVGAAVFGLSQRVSFVESDFQGQAVFPGLLENASDITEMVVRQGGEDKTMVLDGEQWTLKESDGYPVHNNLVTKVMFGLSNMQYLDAKTASPERHEALNLGPPDTREATSQQVTLKNASGEVIADLLVGRANYFLPETTTGGMYVRKPDDNQTWLVRGLVDIGVERRDWLIREIINVSPDDVLRVEVSQPDGEELIVVPQDEVTGGFAFENMPDGHQLTVEFAPRNIAALLVNFVLNDVRRDTSVDLAPEDAYVASFEIEGGLRATLRIWEQDDIEYLRVETAYVGDDPNSELAQMSEMVNARADGWTYIIPEYQYEQISRKLADVIEPVSSGS